MRLQIILAEEMALFCARISKYPHKTVFLLANSNPRRKIGRFFCEDYCLSTGKSLAAPEEFLFGEEAGDGYHQEGVDEAADDAPER